MVTRKTSGWDAFFCACAAMKTVLATSQQTSIRADLMGFRLAYSARQPCEQIGRHLPICSLILSSVLCESGERIACGCRSSSTFFTIAITAKNISKITTTDTNFLLLRKYTRWRYQ